MILRTVPLSVSGWACLSLAADKDRGLLGSVVPDEAFSFLFFRHIPFIGHSFRML